MSVPEINEGDIEKQSQLSEVAAELDSLPSFDEHMQIDHPEAQSQNQTEKEPAPRVEIVDMTETRGGELAGEFPGGMYLFHSTDMESAKKILESGAIMNAGALHDRNLAARRAELEAEGRSEEEIQEELKKVHTRRNSGNEGVSWSCNGISALAGEKGHIVGFLAAPTDVLGDDKLVIPSRPAPYEFLQVSETVDTKKFFEIKMQYEVWGYKDLSVSEKASVDNGLLRLRMHADYGDAYSSQLSTFCENGGLPAEELRQHFEIAEDGHVRIDEQLHQQSFEEDYLPPAAVFIQSMIDRGMFEGTEYARFGVNEIVAEASKNRDLLLHLIRNARREGEYLESEYEVELEKAQEVSVPVEQMFLVINPNDLGMWEEEIEKAKHRPKGILLYDAEKVVTPNFAQEKEGDHQALAQEIDSVVSVDADFWRRDMGIDLDSAQRAGSTGQVLTEKEAARLRNSEFRLVDGVLTKVES